MSSKARFWVARLSAAMYLAAVLLLVGAEGSRAVTYTVTTTADAGPGSLRQAIADANESAGADTIRFAILEPAVVILLSTQLPDIIDPVTIDATTQPGYVDRPLVEIRGPEVPDAFGQLRPTVPGLVLAGASAGSIVRGLSVTRFTVGVVLSTGGNSVEGNWIGVGIEAGAGPNVTGIQVR